MEPPKTYEDVTQIRARLKSAFAPSYLTLLSIIQATALAALFGKIDALIDRHAFNAPQVVLAAGLFLVIALTWNQYQMGLTLFVWVPQLLDAFIPFSLGVCEFVAIQGLGRDSIVTPVTLGVFFALGIVAFEYLYFQVRAGYHEDAPIHRIVAGDRGRDIWLCVLSGIVMFGVAIALVRAPDGGVRESAAGCAIIAVSVAQAIRQWFNWRGAMRRLRAYP